MLKVYKGNTQIIEGLTNEEFNKIAEDLSLLNPAYEKAKKFSGYDRIFLPKYLYYYNLHGSAVEVPIGYRIPFKHIVLKDERIEVTVLYPPIHIQLRESQDQARKCYLDDPEKGIIVMPTGMGKSILGIYLAYCLRQKCLVIVHKNDLIDGWKKDIEFCFKGKVKPGLIKGKKREIGEQITLATIQTLNRLTPEEIKELSKEFGMVIIDECLVGDTLIVKADGGFDFIKNIVNNDTIVGGTVSNKFSRMSEIWRLESSHSFIEGSPTHPTFVLPQEKINKRGKNKFTIDDLEVRCLKDIRAGDYVPVLKNVPHTVKYDWTPEQLSFVALIQADGHLDKNSKSNRIKINVTKDREFYKEIFIKGVKAFSPSIEVKENLDCRGNLTLWVNSKELKDILEYTFEIPRGKKSTSIKINEQIQYAPKESIRAYIETLFNCEGDLSAKKEGQCRINFNTTSKYFALGLSHLLKKFGVVSNYLEVKGKRENHSTIYRISVGGYHFNKFFEEFTLIERKMPTLRNNHNIMRRYDLGDYELVRVKNVYKTDRVEEVYDFTTTNHIFIANGLLTHNCHHTPASSYAMINNFYAYYKIGLSATPERNDGLDKVMNFYLGDIAYKYEMKKENEDILPVKVIKRYSKAFYRPIVVLDKGIYRLKKKTDSNLREWYIDELPFELRPKISYHAVESKAILDERTIEIVCRDIVEEFNRGRNMIVFFNQKEHCRVYYDYLRVTHKIPTEKMQLYYGDSKESVEEMKEKAENGDVRITIATYSIATEGTNVRAWEVAFLVGSLNNGKNVEQAVGRIRRTKEGKINPVLVYDYRYPNVYMLKNHGYNRDLRYKKLKFQIEP